MKFKVMPLDCTAAEEEKSILPNHTPVENLLSLYIFIPLSAAVSPDPVQHMDSGLV